MKSSLQSSVLFVLILMLLAGSSYATIWGGPIPPQPSKEKDSNVAQNGGSNGNGGDDSLFIVNEELFPECVLNNDEIEVGIYLNYGFWYFGEHFWT